MTDSGRPNAKEREVAVDLARAVSSAILNNEDLPKIDNRDVKLLAMTLLHYWIERDSRTGY